LGELIAAAQTVIDHYEDVSGAAVRSLYDETAAVPLIAAARILDAAAKASDLSADERQKLAALAVVAFGMYGNSLSASAVARRLIATEGGTMASPLAKWQRGAQAPTPLRESLAVALATAAPQLTGKLQAWCSPGSKERVYLDLIADYLRTGTPAQGAALRQSLRACLLATDVPLAEVLLFASRLCLEHMIQLSTASVLTQHWPTCPQGYIERLVDAGVHLLLPPQYNALVSKQLLSRKGNVLIALPTSSGKTLLGEFTLVAALGSKPGLVCYLAPYVALGRQVAAVLRQHLPKQYRIHALVGGHRGDVRLEPDVHREVVVATPERFDLILRSMPDLIGHVKCIVCDEAQMIQGGKRGTKLEGILARIKMRQAAGSEFQVALMSAVLPDYKSLQKWMSIGEDRLLVDTWRPTARRLAVWNQSGQLTWYIGSDPIRMAGASNDDVLGRTTLLWPRTHFYGADNFGAIAKQEPDVLENVAYLVDTIYRQYGGAPILCYCASKHSSRKLAAAISARLPSLEPPPSGIAATLALIARKYSVLRPLASMLRKGVAYHNASLPHEVRVQLEEAIKRQECVAVTATTTLAEGVDLPFRFTVLADWLAWDETTKQTPVGGLLFRNIAGRCGRAGVMTEGDTIIFDNPVGDPQLTNPFNRRRTQLDLYVNPLRGSLSSALASVSQQSAEYEGCLAELSSQFLAAISENPDQEDLVSLFSGHLYSALDSHTAPRVRSHLAAARASMLDESREALAMAASPLTLTAFGRAALTTSFSPESCRAILQCLRSQAPTTTPAEVGHHLLLRLGVLPEQYDQRLRKSIAGKKNNQLQIKVDDLPKLLQMWLAGSPLDQMFLSLPVLARSSKTPKISAWAAGLDEPTVWDDDFDKFCEAIKTLFQDFLPWLMFACKQLSPTAGGWSETISWDVYSTFYEHGADSIWACRLLDTELPIERGPAAILGRKMPGQWLTETDPLGFIGLRVEASRFREFEAIVAECVAEAGGNSTPAGAGLRALMDIVVQASAAIG
jgi:helicase